MPRRTDILFPIETINRELDFRLWLACLHASPHRRIFIGQHDTMAGCGSNLRDTAPHRPCAHDADDNVTRHHCPVNTGLRFSRNALTPSA